MNFRIAPQARQDLTDIWQFIAQDNPPAADQVTDAIKAHFRQIAERSESGRPRDELSPGLRSLTIRRYRRYIVFYRLSADAVDIVRVLHGARNLKRLFSRQPPKEI
jgi:toxin ParE1/3/4